MFSEEKRERGRRKKKNFKGYIIKATQSHELLLDRSQERAWSCGTVRQII